MKILEVTPKEKKNKYLDDLGNRCKFSKEEFFSNDNNQKIILLCDLIEKGIIKKIDKDLECILDEIRKDLEILNINKQSLENFLSSGEKNVIKKLKLLKYIKSDYNPENDYLLLIKINIVINNEISHLVYIKNSLSLFHKKIYIKVIDEIESFIRDINTLNIYQIEETKDKIFKFDILMIKCQQINEVKDFILFKIIYDDIFSPSEEEHFDKAMQKLTEIKELFDSNENIEEIYKKNKKIFDKIKDLCKFTSKAELYIDQIKNYFNLENIECIDDLAILIKSKSYEVEIKCIIFFFQIINPNDIYWNEILPKEYGTLSELSLSEIKTILTKLRMNDIFNKFKYQEEFLDYSRFFSVLYGRKDVIQFLLSKTEEDIQSLYKKIEYGGGALTKDVINDCKKCVSFFSKLKFYTNNLEIFLKIKLDCSSETIKNLESFIKNYSQIALELEKKI